MANIQYYCITKKGKSGDIVYFDYEKLSDGYDIKPKNSFYSLLFAIILTLIYSLRLYI